LHLDLTIGLYQALLQPLCLYRPFKDCIWRFDWIVNGMCHSPLSSLARDFGVNGLGEEG
jgi:hypothetical protein